jgi:hypothetical protein
MTKVRFTENDKKRLWYVLCPLFCIGLIAWGLSNTNNLTSFTGDNIFGYILIGFGIVLFIVFLKTILPKKR